jgi:protein Mpv17
MSFLHVLASRPTLKAALTSGIVMTAGDALCQVIRNHNNSPPLYISSSNPSWQWQQSLRFGIIGLTLHGPFFFRGFRWLDTTFGSSPTLKSAIIKVAIGQLTLFPTYLASFTIYMGLLEGLSLQQCQEKLKRTFADTYIAGSVFWPTANMFNFLLLPPTARVVFINGAGLFWNAYLSFVNSTAGSSTDIIALNGRCDKKKNSSNIVAI